MKVTVERSELLKSLGHVHRVVERRNTIPILANVLLHADKAKLSLKATDLDVEVTDAIAAEVGPGGSTTVPAHMFFDIVRKLPEGAQIILESSGDRAALAFRRFLFLLYIKYVYGRLKAATIGTSINYFTICCSPFENIGYFLLQYDQ